MNRAHRDRAYIPRALATAVLLVALAAGTVSAAERRVALVVGNSDYRTDRLRNPANDAEDMAATLKNLGFEVILKTNQNRSGMRAAIRDFAKALRKGGVGLFYYAGHGVQIRGRNYLIPLGTEMLEEFELQEEAVSADLVLRAMEDAGNDMNIVLLDACRNNPFARSWRSVTRGLARMSPPSGALIVYSTRPGDVARDGDGRNSPFTKNLIEEMNRPGVELLHTVRNVAVDVERETGGAQIPWFEGITLASFYFHPAVPGGGADSPPIQPAADDPPHDAVIAAAAPSPSVEAASLQVVTTPRGAGVFIDGKNYGPAPVTVPDLRPGDHHVRAEMTGFEAGERTVEVRLDQMVSVRIGLVQKMAKWTRPDAFTPREPLPAADPRAPASQPAYKPVSSLRSAEGLSLAVLPLKLNGEAQFHLRDFHRGIVEGVTADRHYKEIFYLDIESDDRLSQLRNEIPGLRDWDDAWRSASNPDIKMIIRIGKYLRVNHVLAISASSVNRVDGYIIKPVRIYHVDVRTGEVRKIAQLDENYLYRERLEALIADLTRKMMYKVF